MADQAMIEAIALEAYDACTIGFNEEEGRPMSQDEDNTSRRASLLGVQWTTTQPVSRFLPDEVGEGVGASFDYLKLISEVLQEEMARFAGGLVPDEVITDGVGSPEEREARRAAKRKMREAVAECKDYIEANWEGAAGEGVGFIIALISAVIWHLIIVLIVRWIIRHYFENPDVAAQMCLAT